MTDATWEYKLPQFDDNTTGRWQVKVFETLLDCCSVLRKQILEETGFDSNCPIILVTSPMVVDALSAIEGFKYDTEIKDTAESKKKALQTVGTIHNYTVVNDKNAKVNYIELMLGNVTKTIDVFDLEKAGL